MTPRRQQRLQAAVRHRVSNVRFAFENTFDPHNAAAGLRSLEAMGFDEVDQISESQTQPNARVAIGAWKWMNLRHYTSIERWQTQSAGFQIWASHVGDNEPASLLDWTPDIGPTIFVLGNEHSGITQEMQSIADVQFGIPMLGMVESYNLSVATSLVAWHVRNQLGWDETANEWLPAEAQSNRLHQWNLS